MKGAETHCIEIGGRLVDYRLIGSRQARRMRIRAGLDGIVVVHPLDRTPSQISSFLEKNRQWVTEQAQRIERLRAVRIPRPNAAGEILFKGNPTPVRVEARRGAKGRNCVLFEGGAIRVVVREGGSTAAVKSLENWLRKQARAAIMKELAALTPKVKRAPHRLYVMGQRTKWGNCSALGNLSFSWRLIQLPEFVMRYLVTHEAVHLAIPDHSTRFWLTVQSLCPEAERARQWLSRNGADIPLTLDKWEIG